MPHELAKSALRPNPSRTLYAARAARERRIKGITHVFSALKTYAVKLSRMENYEAAVRLMQVFELNPSDSYRYEVRSYLYEATRYEIYALMGDYSKANRIINNAIKSNEISQEVLCKRVKNFLKRGMCQNWEKEILAHLIEEICTPLSSPMES